jgi:hypothetical protein
MNRSHHHHNFFLSTMLQNLRILWYFYWICHTRKFFVVSTLMLSRCGIKKEMKHPSDLQTVAWLLYLLSSPGVDCPVSNEQSFDFVILHSFIMNFGIWSSLFCDFHISVVYVFGHHGSLRSHTFLFSVLVSWWWSTLFFSTSGWMGAFFPFSHFALRQGDRNSS